MTTTPPPPPGQEHQQTYGTTWEDPQPGQEQPHQGWGPGHLPAPPIPPAPESPKRSWFRRHKILTALLALVALIVVVNLAGGDGETTTTAGEPAPNAEQAPAEPEEPAGEEPVNEGAAAADQVDADDDPAAEGPAADQDETAGEAENTAQADSEVEAEEPAPSAGTPGPGDAVRDGTFEFTVNDVQTGVTSIGEGFTQESPQGQFVLINVTVTNIGDTGTALFDSNQILIDDQGRQHETSSSSIWLEETISLDDINPGNSISGILLYDIPTDAVPTSLELHDSMFSGGVTVTLQ